MNKSVGVVILSRYSSSRLPGKALMEIEGKKVLEYIIERLRLVFEAGQIVIATSEEASDDPIACFADQSEVGLHRGSLENVAERFYQAGAERGWDYAIRINGDNIFLDTEVLREMKQITLGGDYDLISNVKGRSFPKGMSVEIVKLDFYASLLPTISADAHYREHVTLYLYEHEKEGNYHHFRNLALPEAAGVQMALDTPEDLARSRALIQRFTAAHTMYNMNEIFQLLKT